MNKIMICTVACTAAFAMLMVISRTGFSADPAPAFESATFKSADGQTMPYRLLKPSNFDPKQKYPLVVFFHGAGERGTDNQKQLVNGGWTFAKPEIRAKYQCFVLAPQCPDNKSWVGMDFGTASGTMPKDPTPSMKIAIELIAATMKEQPVDPKRVYVTGLSMGGFATWDILCRYPTMFAAAAPVCGGGDETKVAPMAKVPVWAFHSADDPTVKVARTRNMIQAMKDAGGSPKYTEYNGVGHGAWGKAYGDPELYAWMFAQKLP